MGSGTRGAAVAVAGLLLTACGNYSTEDVRYAEALPAREDLRVEVPVPSAAPAPGANGGPGAEGPAATGPAACGAAPATAWLWAGPVAQGLNSGLDLVLGFVETVRGVAPTWRSADARGWGPWPDSRHPGREVRMAMTRSFPEGAEAGPRFAYELQARLADPTSPWTTLLTGELRGGLARQGTGTLSLDLDGVARLGLADPGTPQQGLVTVEYDRSTSQVRIALTLDHDGFGLTRSRYRFSGAADRSGTLEYAIRDPGGDLFVVDAAFDGAGRGRATVDLRSVGGLTARYALCWGADACTVWLDDPLGQSGLCSGPPCTVGSPASCTAAP